MKKIKKQLPALLLALLVAIMPVMMATPVCAAWVEEYVYNGVVLPKLPDDVTSIAFIVVDSQGIYYIGTSKVQTSNISFDVWARYVLVDGEWVTRDNSTSIFGTLVWTNYDIGSDGQYAMKASDIVVRMVEVKDPPVVLDPDDLLSVFSGVGSWFSDFALDFTEMFYVGGALTFLGILAVACLGLAVLLLMLYLIAGWLKFR